MILVIACLLFLYGIHIYKWDALMPNASNTLKSMKKGKGTLNRFKKMLST